MYVNSISDACIPGTIVRPSRTLSLESTYHITAIPKYFSIQTSI